MSTKSVAPVANHDAGRKLFSSKIASSVVWIITLIWTIPTFGLFVSSFRDKQAIFDSGWWTAFTHPHFSLANYHSVLFGNTAASGL